MLETTKNLPLIFVLLYSLRCPLYHCANNSIFNIQHPFMHSVMFIRAILLNFTQEVRRINSADLTKTLAIGAEFAHHIKSNFASVLFAAVISPVLVS